MDLFQKKPLKLKIFWKSRSICNFLSGKKPQKKKLFEKPLTETAAVAAEDPGTGNILILFLMHSFIKIPPGSEIVGVPASEIIEIILFSFNKFKTFFTFFFSLNLWLGSNLVFILNLDSSLLETLVSSDKIRSELFRISMALKVISPKFPMGVETQYSPGFKISFISKLYI